MKANELMIGDWVQKLEVGGHYRKGQIKAIIDDNVDVATSDGEIHTLSVNGIEPIPLTGEILEKNGFKVGHYLVGLAELPEYKMVNRKDLKDIEKNVITIRQSSNVLFDMQVGIGSHIFDITYVHELQHALRLCGIEKEIEL